MKPGKSKKTSEQYWQIEFMTIFCMASSYRSPSALQAFGMSH